MNYKHSCVIDAAGFYVTLVLVLLEQNESDEIEENIQYYTLKDGESLLDVPAPPNYIKPRWNGEEWEEAATPEEIAEWEREHPTPPPTEPSPVDVLGAQVAQLTIDNIQKDQIIDAMGAQLAQTSLDVMTMKGGA